MPIAIVRYFQKPGKRVLLAAALFSICGLVFAGYSFVTSSKFWRTSQHDAPSSSINVASDSAPPSGYQFAEGESGSHNAPHSGGNGHHRGGHRHSGATHGALGGSSDGPENTGSSFDSPHSFDAGSGVAMNNSPGGDGPSSSVFNDQGGDSGGGAGGMGGAGGPGGGGSGGGGPSSTNQCETLVGCNPLPNSNPQSGSGPGTPTPVPEPETYAMLLAGLGIMGAVARRRKAK